MVVSRHLYRVNCVQLANSTSTKKKRLQIIRGFEDQPLRSVVIKRKEVTGWKKLLLREWEWQRLRILLIFVP